MWTGIAAGLKDIEDKKRYEREYEDKLNLLNQERQDRLFSTILEYAPMSVLTSSSGSTGSGGSAGTPSAAFYEEQLLRYKFPEKAILDLQEQGPLAMQAAIEVYQKNFDPDNPYDESTLTKIADSIILDKVTISQGIDPVEYAKQMGLNMDLFPENERGVRTAILSGALRKGVPKPAVASTYTQESRVKLEDLDRFKKNLGDSITAFLGEKKLTVPEDQQGVYQGALSAIDNGSYAKAFELLGETGDLKTIAQSVFEYYPQYKNPKVPLGLFEPLRKALEVPSIAEESLTAAQIPQQAIEALRQNRDNPDILEAFRVKYGVDPEEYL